MWIFNPQFSKEKSLPQMPFPPHKKVCPYSRSDFLIYAIALLTPHRFSTAVNSYSTCGKNRFISTPFATAKITVPSRTMPQPSPATRQISKVAPT